MAAKELMPQIMPRADHLISYHIVTAGHCYGGVIGEEHVELAAGDVILFPHGDAHAMSGDRVTPKGAVVHVSTPKRYRQTVQLGDEGPPTATFVCGFFGCDRRPFNGRTMGRL